MIPDKEPSYSVQFFQDWIRRLEDDLKQSAPLSDILRQEPAFHRACQTVQSWYGAKLRAEQARDKVASNHTDEKNNAESAVKTAQEALDSALETCVAAGREILVNRKEIATLLQQDDNNDAKWITYSILRQSGPEKLTAWCQQQDSKFGDFLDDISLQRKFLQGGGAGDYGRAVELYHQLGCPGNNENNNRPAVLDRLALAVALELSVPVLLFGHTNAYVDPIQRYVHYKQAYELGELDPAFDTFTVWELRHVVNCDATDEELGWGRQSLMAYRPNLVYYNSDPQWRYCRLVRTDISYNAPVWYKEPRSYDQILSGGGKCGPRAWYGRFICKAFGIPTWGVRQPGHAAMTRWTTEGWKTCFGVGFEKSWWQGRGGLDFQLETQCRDVLGNNGAAYLQKVCRLEWLAVLFKEDAETIRSKCLPSPKNLWFALAWVQRKLLVSTAVKEDVAVIREQQRVGCVPKGRNKINNIMNRGEDEEEVLLYNKDGSIVIPAAVTSKPSRETNHIFFPKSFLGGRQLILVNDASVEYQVAAPSSAEARVYQLTCKFCTVHRQDDSLEVQLCARDGDNVSSGIVKLPYTHGVWEESVPVQLTLPTGTSTMRVNRLCKNYGMTIKEFRLVPV